jgi:hypothetical protein
MLGKPRGMKPEPLLNKSIRCNKPLSFCFALSAFFEVLLRSACFGEDGDAALCLFPLSCKFLQVF